MGRIVSTLHTGGSRHVVGTRSVLIPFLPLPLARTMSLRLVSLPVLLLSLWNQITCRGNANAEECKTCGYNYKELPVRMRGGRGRTPGSLKERRSPVGPDPWLGRKGELGVLEYLPLEDRGMD